MKKAILCITVIFLLALAGTAAHAHMLWLNPMNYTPAVGSTTEIGIGFGHSFPANRVEQEVKEDKVAAIKALGPDGQEVPLVKTAPDRYQLKIEKAGAYVITAGLKPGFFTMTPEGRKWGDKKEIANGIKCTNFHIEAKAVLLAGNDGQNRDRATGQTVDLILLSDPRQVKAGEKLEAQVLYQGKPLADAVVKAVYAGYEAPKSTENASTQKGHGVHHYPVEAQTDAQGRVVFAPDRAGHWLAIVSHKPAYGDKETCDEYMYNVTYAFEVK